MHVSCQDYYQIVCKAVLSCLVLTWMMVLMVMLIDDFDF